jgi:glucose-6-phosphate isomerase
MIKIQPNIGGRFLLLSSAGIIPLALTGIKIDCLLKGAAKIKDSFLIKAICKMYYSKSNFLCQEFFKL